MSPATLGKNKCLFLNKLLFFWFNQKAFIKFGFKLYAKIVISGGFGKDLFFFYFQFFNVDAAFLRLMLIPKALKSSAQGIRFNRATYTDEESEID